MPPHPPKFDRSKNSASHVSMESSVAGEPAAKMSGADIVKDDLKRQLREIQVKRKGGNAKSGVCKSDRKGVEYANPSLKSKTHTCAPSQSSCELLVLRKKRLEQSKVDFEEKIEELKAPSDNLVKMELEGKKALDRIERLSKQLQDKGCKGGDGSIWSDEKLKEKIREIQERKVKIDKLKEDKKFLLKLIIKLTGQGEVKSMIKDIKDAPAGMSLDLKVSCSLTTSK